MEIHKLIPGEASYFLEFRAEKTKPSLCLGIVAGGTVLPNTIEEVNQAIDSLSECCPNPALLEVGPYNLLIGGEDAMPVGEINLDYISLVVNNFLFNNLSFFNYIEDLMLESVARIPFATLYANMSSYDTFISAIMEQFEVTAEILRVNAEDGPISSLCRDCHFPPAGREAIRGQILHALSRAQVIEATIDTPPAGESQSEAHYRYVFPVRSKPKGIIQSNEFVLLEAAAGRRLSVLEIFSINEIVEEFAYTRVRLGQRRCLYWQTECITSLIESVDNTAIDQAEQFRVYMGELAQFVVSSTQGHSFAYLSYDASQEALCRTVATFKPIPEEADADPEALALVPLKDHHHYISAHLFHEQSQGAEREMYLPAIRNRAEWAEFGLTSVRCRRNALIDSGAVQGAQTQSEAAFIIHDQGIPVGVICVECPYRDGLANDMDFLRQVASNASIYRSFLFRMGDQRWLRRNLRLQDVAHELEKLGTAIKDREVKLRLAEITGDLAIDLDHEEQDGRSFVARVDHVVREEVDSDALLAEMGQPVKVFNPDRHDLPHSIQMAAIHIIRILLQNRLHEGRSGQLPSPITVVTRDFHAGVRNALLIRQVLHMNLPESEIQDAFRRPIRRADREHVGLYMIGVLVRAWGGRLDFDRSAGVTERQLEICIPFRRSSGGSNDGSDTHTPIAV